MFLQINAQEGEDMGKWARAKVSSLCTADTHPEASLACRARWEQKRQPFPAAFVTTDVTQPSFLSDLSLPENVGQYIGSSVLFDVICCFHYTSYLFSSEESARAVLLHISKLLKRGGLFFGTLADSSSIWYKAQKSLMDRKKSHILNELFDIQFDNDQFNHFGSAFHLQMPPHQTESHYLVHFPSLIRLAREVGLQMLSLCNYNEFFDDNRKNYHDVLKTMKVLTKHVQKLEPNQKELASMFTTFVFVKDE